MTIKKRINNNLLCVIDGETEMIVAGKGIGFKSEPGEEVDESKIEKRYQLIDQKEEKKYE